MYISQGFPEIDNFGINARIVLEKNKFSKNVTAILPPTGIKPLRLGL